VATNNQVLFQADKLDVGFFPTLFVDGENVSVDLTTLPTIEAKKISVSPSLFSLISLSTGSPPTSINANVSAEGLFGGNVAISHKPDGTSDDGAKKNRLLVKADAIQLGELEKLFDSPVSFEGRADLSTDIDFFPGFDGQPEGKIDIASKGVKIPAGTIPTQFGPIPIPGVSWSQLVMKARMSASNLILDDISFGNARDPMSGRVKGNMNLRVDRAGPILGAYDIKVELLVTAAAEKELDTLLIMLKDFRQPSGVGGKYVFRVTANSASAQPNLGRLTTF
jgi:hypothetical protein